MARDTRLETLLDDDTSTLVTPLHERMERRQVDPGAVLVRQGDASNFFLMIESGTASVERDAGDGPSELATVGPGDVIGELGLLRQRKRLASVRALTPMVVWEGDAAVFEMLLDTPAINERMRAIVSTRLAQRAEAVPAEMEGKPTIWLRPLLPTDRDGLERAAQAASAETLRKRFFTAAMPSERMLDYLVYVDYIDHFAWVAMSEEGEGVGVGRYIRDADDRHRAEFAFTVTDDWHGSGVGTRLLAAVGVAAQTAAIDELHASFLAENGAARALFAKADARFGREEPGVSDAIFCPRAAAALLPASVVNRLEAAVSDIVRAAGLALAPGSTHGVGPDRHG